MGKIFVTNRANKGLEVVAGKYQFLNGEFPASDEDAEKLEPILCRFYGCTIEDGDSSNYDEAAESISVILASQAVAAENSGMAAAVEANIAAGEAAGDPNNIGTLSGPAFRLGDELALNTSGDNDPDPKNVSNQNISNEHTNHVNTGGDGTRVITGVNDSAPVDADNDSGNDE